MNNSKQAVLSIVGIAILVIAVVGVSFAFFTYSRTGTRNNVITTGSIVFDSDIDTVGALSLTNKFPQTNAEGASNSAYQFRVYGTIPSSAKTVNYGVFVVDSTVADSNYTAPTGKNSANKFPYGEISIMVSGPQSGATVVSPYDETTGGGPLGSAVGTTTGLKVAYGSVANGSSIDHSYSLTMWVNDTVTISDTTSGADYRAHKYIDETDVENSGGTLTNAAIWTEKPSGSNAATEKARKVYSDMWYSIQVRVDASDTQSYAS